MEVNVEIRFLKREQTLSQGSSFCFSHRRAIRTSKLVPPLYSTQTTHPLCFFVLPHLLYFLLMFPPVSLYPPDSPLQSFFWCFFDSTDPTQHSFVDLQGGALFYCVATNVRFLCTAFAGLSGRDIPVHHCSLPHRFMLFFFFHEKGEKHICVMFFSSM